MSSWALAGTGTCLGLLMLLGGGCAGGPLEDEDSVTGELTQEVMADNGLSTNGLSTNGLSTNGLSTNGLSTNGLSTNGLSAVAFSLWFNGNESATYSDMVMKYVIACALPAGQTRSWTNPISGVRYVWPGVLGLATAWAQGSPATLAEQQLVSACLAAHVNKFGKTVPISVLGRNATGRALPVTSAEAAEYTEQEACFFGNLFTGEGTFVGSDRTFSRKESSVRACGIAAQNAGGSVECAPLQHVGLCSSACVKDDTHAFWQTCTVNGRTYRALTTHLRPQDIYTCGDGTCQFTESCGTGGAYNNCGSDCLACGGTSPRIGDVLGL